jgi:hypothetical protein
MLLSSSLPHYYYWEGFSSAAAEQPEVTYQEDGLVSLVFYHSNCNSHYYYYWEWKGDRPYYAFYMLASSSFALA